jgi:hypothetical protein
MPSRPVLGERVAVYLKTVFPGLDWASTAWAWLAEAVGSLVAQQSDVFVVYREELADDGNLARSLVDGFGAELGDQIVEVQPGDRAGELTTRRWNLGEVP